MNRTRLPLAEMSIFSAMLAPLKSIVSVPAWPSTVSLPSPGFQTKVSSPAPSRATSLPSPPLIRSLPWLPMSDVVAVAAVEGRAGSRRPAGRWRRSMSSPAEAVDASAGRWPLRCADDVAPRRAGPMTSTPPPSPATSIVSSPSVPLTMTVSACAVAAARRRPAQVEVDLRDVGAGQVVDGDRVGAAEGVEVDLLDAVEVHGDVADVAGEADAGCRWPRCRCSRRCWRR